MPRSVVMYLIIRTESAFLMHRRDFVSAIRAKYRIIANLSATFFAVHPVTSHSAAVCHKLFLYVYHTPFLPPCRSACTETREEKFAFESLSYMAFQIGNFTDAISQGLLRFDADTAFRHTKNGDEIFSRLRFHFQLSCLIWHNPSLWILGSH